MPNHCEPCCKDSAKESKSVDLSHWAVLCIVGRSMTGATACLRLPFPGSETPRAAHPILSNCEDGAFLPALSTLKRVWTVRSGPRLCLGRLCPSKGQTSPLIGTGCVPPLREQGVWSPPLSLSKVKRVRILPEAWSLRYTVQQVRKHWGGV